MQHNKKYNEERFSQQESDLSSSEKSQKKLQKGLERSFEFFLDDLSKEQISELKIFSEIQQAYPLKQTQFRKEFVEIFFKAASDKQAEKQALADLVLQRFSLARLAELKPEDRKLFTEANLHLILKIWGMTSSEQKANFKKEILDLKEMISALP